MKAALGETTIARESLLAAGESVVRIQIAAAYNTKLSYRPGCHQM